MSHRKAQLEAHERTPTDAGEWRTLAPASWDWATVRRVLVVRLRSIGDTVLITPALHALRRFVPHAEIDVLLEDWVAPLLEGSTDCDRIITTKRHASLAARVGLARELRAARYDVAFNLHGGPTATLLIRASGATHRIGAANYQFAHLHNHLVPPGHLIWGGEKTHAVEHHLALVGWAGVPVNRRAPTRLTVTDHAAQNLEAKLRKEAGDGFSKPFAVIHPAAAFESKRWATANFARLAEHVTARGLTPIAVAAPHEAKIIKSLKTEARVPVLSFTDLSLPEIKALLARSSLFVGNDSGIAHIAAALRLPVVVIFGSSDIACWRPWTPINEEASATLRAEMPCAPCPGYTCTKFAAPECIRRVTVEQATATIDRILENSWELRVRS
jgi:lipopolysaccharide heptosyltransferase II